MKRKKVNHDEAERLAKIEIGKMSGSGCFSTAYYVKLLNKVSFKIWKEGVIQWELR